MFYFMCFFFFKQKTAYEIRISDWSSYVFSSDLPTRARAGAVRCRTQAPPQPVAARLPAAHGADLRHLLHRRTVLLPDGRLAGDRLHGRRRAVDLPGRSEERRVGKEGGKTCRLRWSTYHKKKKKTYVAEVHYIYR